MPATTTPGGERALPATTSPPALLPPVTVTATRHAQPVAATSAAVTVLTRADLAPLGNRALEDVLATHAGMTFARTGGTGQQTSLFLRGTDSNQVLVLIDGVKANPGTLGLPALQNLRAADIERIEVVRGPRSTLYGADAIGGVVSITTRRAAGTGVAVEAAGGSNNTRDLRARAAVSGIDGTLAVGGGSFRTDGERLFDAVPVEGAHENDSGTLHAATEFGELALSADAWVSEGSTQYLDTFTLLPLQQDSSNSAVGTRAELPLADSLAAALQLGLARDDIAQRQPNFLGQLDHATTERETVTAELRQQGWTHHDLSAGVEGQRERVDALSFGTAVREANDQRAAFLRDALTLGRHTLVLGARHTRHDAFGEHWTGEASWSYAPDAATLGWLAWGSGFRAPDSSERFGFGGNPALQPETTDAVEAGLRRQFGAHALTLTGFLQEIDDLIDYPAPAFIATNIARARITGTELGWQWAGTATRAGAQLTLLDAVDDTTGARLSRRPEQQLSAHLRRQLGQAGIGAELLAMDARDNSAYDNIRLPGFAVVNLLADWQWREALTLSARVDNVADREYALAADAAGTYLMPGRAVLLGVAWQLP